MWEVNRWKKILYLMQQNSKLIDIKELCSFFIVNFLTSDFKKILKAVFCIIMKS